MRVALLCVLLAAVTVSGVTGGVRRCLYFAESEYIGAGVGVSRPFSPMLVDMDTITAPAWIAVTSGHIGSGTCERTDGPPISGVTGGGDQCRAYSANTGGLRSLGGYVAFVAERYTPCGVGYAPPTSCCDPLAAGWRRMALGPRLVEVAEIPTPTEEADDGVAPTGALGRPELRPSLPDMQECWSKVRRWSYEICWCPDPLAAGWRRMEVAVQVVELAKVPAPAAAGQVGPTLAGPQREPFTGHALSDMQDWRPLLEPEAQFLEGYRDFGGNPAWERHFLDDVLPCESTYWGGWYDNGYVSRAQFHRSSWSTASAATSLVRPSDPYHVGGNVAWWSNNIEHPGGSGGTPLANLAALLVA